MQMKRGKLEMPRVFISYSWEDAIHKAWVRDLAITLRKDGVEVILDQWDLILGDSLTQFMETAICESDFVLIICTPVYKSKADKRMGGVGYEESIISGQFMHGQKRGKFIPVLRKGNWRESAPTWLMDKMYEDLSGNPYTEENYIHLLATLHNIPIEKPPVGNIPIEKIHGVSNKPVNITLSTIFTDILYQFKKRKHVEKEVKLSVVDEIMQTLKKAETIGECKVLDYKLSEVTDTERVRYYLFNGNQRQRNYAALYFKRKGDVSLLEKAYKEGKIDKIQAFSK